MHWKSFQVIIFTQPARENVYNHLSFNLSTTVWHILLPYVAWPLLRQGVTSRKLPKSGTAHIEMLNPFTEGLLAWPPYDTDVQTEIKRNVEALRMGDVLPLGSRLEVAYNPGAGDWVAKDSAPTSALSIKKQDGASIAFSQSHRACCAIHTVQFKTAHFQNLHCEYCKDTHLTCSFRTSAAH